MFINEDLAYLYRKLDYAIWQKEACSDITLEKNKEAQKLISYYNRKIESIRRKKNMIKQLSLF